MGEYSSEEGKGLNIAVPQEYADYGVSCDAQGNWVYNGKIIADLYDEGRGIFSNSNGTMYIEITRLELWFPDNRRRTECVAAYSSFYPLITYYLNRLNDWGLCFRQCKVCGKYFLFGMPVSKFGYFL